MSAVALLAAGCRGGDSEDTATTAAGGQVGGEVTVRGCNPENPLVPSNTTETCGGTVIDALVAKLVHYEPETAAPKNDIAEAIAASLDADEGSALRQLAAVRPDVADPALALVAAFDEVSKTRGWRMRARIGERKRWYELPDEVG